MIGVLFISLTLPYAFYACLRNPPKIVTFAIGKMKMVFRCFPPRPRMPFAQRYVAINIFNICKGYCGSNSWKVKQNQWQFSCHLHCFNLYLGDNCIQNFHLGRYIVEYTVGNLVLRRRASGAVKRDFRTYIRRYTSSNENFEYGYPHSNALLTFSFKKTVKMYYVAPTYSGCQLHKTACQLHIFTCQPMKSDVT